MPIRLVLALIWALAAPVAAAAQDAWLQIAAERTEPRARAVAERFAEVLPDLSLIEMGSWIAVTAGPFAGEVAETLWRDLRAAGAIPRDSYLSDGARYGTVIWRAATPVPARPLWQRASVAVSADGAVVTLAEGMEACRRITLDRDQPAHLVAQNGVLALLQTEKPAGATMPPTLPAGPPAASDGPNRAQLEAGGPVLTRTGALAGLATGGALPDTVPAGAVRAFLTTAGVLLADHPEDAAALAPEVLTRRAEMLTVPVSCWP